MYIKYETPDIPKKQYSPLIGILFYYIIMASFYYFII